MSENKAIDKANLKLALSENNKKMLEFVNEHYNEEIDLLKQEINQLSEILDTINKEVV